MLLIPLGKCTIESSILRKKHKKSLHFSQSVAEVHANTVVIERELHLELNELTMAESEIEVLHTR